MDERASAGLAFACTRPATALGHQPRRTPEPRRVTIGRPLTEGVALLAQDVLSRGYFPKELPPAFNTSAFANLASTLNESVPKTWTVPVALNLARPGTLRRRLALPNPFSQLQLAQACERNWSDLDLHLRQSRLSLSRPVVSTQRGLVPRRDPRGWSAERMSRTRRARYTLRADVSEFYGSVYTHSLAWALHTKSVSKAHLASRGQPPLLGEILDAAVRHGQDGQTKGIPIGPDTSLLVAEIILCSIDVKLQTQHPAVERFGVRFMDDLEFAALSRAEAEDVLLIWEAELAAFDLALNPRKTEIFEGPLSPEEHWQVRLKHFHIRTDTDVKQANDMRSLFTLAFDLARENRTKSVLKYALRRAGSPTGTESWRVYCELVLSTLMTDPSALDAAHGAFQRGRAQGLWLDLSAISETLNELCCYHAPLEHGSEVAWSLYILRELGLKVTSVAAGSVARMRDNCSLVLLLDAYASNRIEGAAPDLSPVVARAEDPGAWRSDDWLLAYEAGRNGWADDAAFRAQPHWAELRRLGVGFYSPSAASPGTLAPTSPASAAGAPLGAPASTSSATAPGSTTSPAAPDLQGLTSAASIARTPASPEVSAVSTPHDVPDLTSAVPTPTDEGDAGASGDSGVDADGWGGYG